MERRQGGSGWAGGRGAAANLVLGGKAGEDVTPTSTLTTEMMTALGADTVTLAAAMFVIPIQTPFTPGTTPALVDADIATFTGATPKATGAATRPVITDPFTGGQKLVIPPPAGGFHWVTTDDTNLPQTIYGVVLGSSSTTIEGGVLFGSELLPSPVELTTAAEDVTYEECVFSLIEPGLM